MCYYNQLIITCTIDYCHGYEKFRKKKSILNIKCIIKLPEGSIKYVCKNIRRYGTLKSLFKNR